MDKQPAAQSPNQPTPSSSEPAPTFSGNSTDLTAIVALTTAAVTGLCCISFGYGIYCLPIVPILLGVVALVNAKMSVNPDRTRRWGWISVGIGGGVLLLMIIALVAFIVLYSAIIWAAMSSSPSRLR